VTIGTGCKEIGDNAFLGCTALAVALLPSTLVWIGHWAFGNCPELATIVIPNGCRVHNGAFEGSKTQVISL
jgi:hypothetical protein